MQRKRDNDKEEKEKAEEKQYNVKRTGNLFWEVDTDHRGVATVHGAEGVVHVDVAELGEASREGGDGFVGTTLALFFGVEPQVFEKDHTTWGWVCASSLNLRTTEGERGKGREGVEAGRMFCGWQPREGEFGLGRRWQ